MVLKVMKERLKILESGWWWGGILCYLSYRMGTASELQQTSSLFHLYFEIYF